MPPVNVLIKPASSACNMACEYCFYRDVSSHRTRSFEGMLTLGQMEQIIASAMEFAEGSCSFAFQGGEPTLAGLDFFRETVKLQKKYSKSGVTVFNSIQTNGLLIDEEWAKFLSEEQFLVGLSLDGPALFHDRNRKDRSGNGTEKRVLNTAKLFDRFQVEYNILCVLTGENARNIDEIYRYYRENGFEYLQFIPCLEPMDRQRGEQSYHLSAEEYADFLLKIFDLWFEDLRKGRYISIRHLDNWLSILLGQRPEACAMTGCCSIQFVVEGDGSVYPCDFYVTDEWKLGNVKTDSFSQLLNSDKARHFVRSSLVPPEECRRCSLAALCRNGCRRDRVPDRTGIPGKNYYCEAYRRFFTERKQQLLHACSIILQMRRQYREQQ